MKYIIILSVEADKDAKELKHNEPKAYGKFLKLLLELQDHPYTGTGHPKQLGKNRQGQWSRRITHKHRLIYEIKESTITVLVLSAYGHYDDK